AETIEALVRRRAPGSTDAEYVRRGPAVGRLDRDDPLARRTDLQTERRALRVVRLHRHANDGVGTGDGRDVRRMDPTRRGPRRQHGRSFRSGTRHGREQRAVVRAERERQRRAADVDAKRSAPDHLGQGAGRDEEQDEQTDPSGHGYLGAPFHSVETMLPVTPYTRNSPPNKGGRRSS